METTTASIYDYPKYYDLVFGSDTASELRFLKQCSEKYVPHQVKRVFEPACGTGRLIYRFGKQGYEVGGIDLNEKAVEFCNQRLKENSIKGKALHGDMSDFEVAKPFDACFNTINSFRHLHTEPAAVAHLQCVARALKVGGIYALGLHLTPTKGEASDREAFSVRRGHVTINTDMWPIEKLPKKRMERFGIRFDIFTPTRSFRIDDVLELRSYTAPQFRKLLAAVPEFELVECFDFHYSIRHPIQLDAEAQDIVAILRKTP